MSYFKGLYKYLAKPAVAIGIGLFAACAVVVALVVSNAIPASLTGHGRPSLPATASEVPNQTPPGPESPIYCGGTNKPFIALSFDDGPGPRTQATVDALHRAGQRATFFLIGRNAERQPDTVKNELQVGTIGDHTWSHPDLVRLPEDRLSDELGRTQTLLRQQSGQQVTLLRPPEGPYNQNVVDGAHRLGMRVVLWNADSRDSEGAPAPKIVQNAEAGLKPGSIVIFHENKPETQRALPQILQAIKDRGLTSVSVPELLALDPPTSQQVEHGPRDCPLPARPHKQPSS